MENTAHTPSGTTTAHPAPGPYPGPYPGGPAPVPDRPGAVAPPTALRARRRRPAVLALSLALIAAGGLGGAALYTASGRRVAVLALARDVPYGRTLTAGDLTIARISTDPALRPLDAASRDRAVGMRATTDLPAGSLLTRADVTDRPLVGPGQQIVGVAAKHTQLPAARLQPSQRVIVVATPDGQSGDAAGAGRTPETVPATVVTVGAPDADGGTVVDVAVPADQGPPLAALVADGHFMVVIASRAGGTGGAG